MMADEIRREAERFQFLTDSGKLTVHDRKRYAALLRMEEAAGGIPDHVMINALPVLSRLLQKHYGQKVIILLDEYDVPLAKAFDKGYYDRMAALIRNIFEQVFKTNESLYFAVMTGCLRIAKESIFTGLNNLKVLSVTDAEFDEYFGFTDGEVRGLLKYYEIPEVYSTVKEWYDGYRFGNVDVYCPWDVICYCDKLRTDREARPQDYWSNTSSNSVVRHFVERADSGTAKREIEKLVAGEAVEKEIRQELTYKELYDSMDNMWSVLFTTGYLTKQGRPEGDMFRLVIPNMEIRKIFTKQIMELFRENARKDGESLQRFCEVLKNGDAQGVEDRLTEYLRKTISIKDTFVRKERKENFYHGILLGLLGFKESWGVYSNRESGDGYGDILVETEDGETGIVIEVKYGENDKLEECCLEALEQIEVQRYEEQLRGEGMTIILKYGIACFKKRCRVMLVGQTRERTAADGK